MTRTTIELLDANALLGRVPTGPGFADVPGLLVEMDRLHIGTALVTHTYAWRHDVATGNDLLLKQLAGQDRLHACWVLLPHATGEVANPEDLLAAAGRAGVAAFRAYPADHGYDLLDDRVSDVLSGLERRRAPLFLGRDQAGWGTVDALARRHPGLPVIITTTGYRDLRSMTGTLDRRPNVRVDLSYLSASDELEWLVERYGPDRVVFGTGLPLRDPADAVTRLLWSGLGDDDAAVVGGRAMKGLLGVDRAGG